MSVIKTIVLLALSLSAAARVTVVPRDSLSIKPDSPDGFYVSKVDGNGHRQTVHFAARDLDNTDTDTTGLEARKEQQGDIHCTNQYVLNWDDMSLAQQGLIDRFKDGKSFKETSTLYKQGTVVAYGCNYGNGQTISGSWLAAQFAAIAQKCGSLSPGYVAYPDWKATYGVGSTARSEKICG